MKNLFLLTVAVLFSAVTIAQTTETKKAETKYCCSKCNYSAETGGTCPHDKSALGLSKTKTMYCCAHCDWSIPPVKGTCPHSTITVYKDGTLNCVYVHDKGGKCPKCGMEMEKIEVKKEKKKKKK